MPTQRPDHAAQLRQDDRDATTYQEQLRVAAVHATVFAIGITAITLINLIINLSAGLTGELTAWWSLWALAGWGLGVTVHLLVVRLTRPTSSNPPG